MTRKHIEMISTHVQNMLVSILTTQDMQRLKHKPVRLSTKLSGGPFKEIVIHSNGKSAEYCEEHPVTTVEDAIDEIYYVGRFMRNGIPE